MAKASIGARIVERLQEFTEDLEKGMPIAEHYTCRRMTLDVKPRRYTTAMVKRTRKMLGVSQTLFAQFLGVSPSTVRAWEQGTNTPSDVASRFMDEIRLDPPYWMRRFRGAVRIKGTRG